MVDAFGQTTRSGVNNDIMGINDATRVNESMEDAIHARLSADVHSLSEKVRKFTKVINNDDMLGSLFDKVVAKSKHTDKCVRRRLSKSPNSNEGTEYLYAISFMCLWRL
ncbi:hypothetical protein JCM33374_g3189 [Metschnikowia sp. JCM 33374]|nr:hypothetical protein JCM33374_g3189 [Metschnikowia sp. JCM 33374]